jgi:hypothetical protein
MEPRMHVCVHVCVRAFVCAMENWRRERQKKVGKRQRDAENKEDSMGERHCLYMCVCVIGVHMCACTFVNIHVLISLRIPDQ